MISKSLKGKLRHSFIFVIPVISILMILSINIYFSDEMFGDIFRTEESVVAIIIGTVVGLTVSFYTKNKIRRHHVRNLHELEALYHQLISEQQ